MSNGHFTSETGKGRTDGCINAQHTAPGQHSYLKLPTIFNLGLVYITFKRAHRIYKTANYIAFDKGNLSGSETKLY